MVLEHASNAHHDHRYKCTARNCLQLCRSRELPSTPTASHSLTPDLATGPGLLLCTAIKPGTNLYRMYPDTQINAACGTSGALQPSTPHSALTRFSFTKPPSFREGRTPFHHSFAEIRFLFLCLTLPMAICVPLAHCTSSVSRFLLKCARPGCFESSAGLYSEGGSTVTSNSWTLSAPSKA